MVEPAGLCQSIVLWSLLLVLSAASTVGAAGAELEYGARGNRHEGLKPKPVSGYDIELIGAMAIPSGGGLAAAMDPSSASLSFYLPEARTVSVVVREKEPRAYYWLDRVQPARPFWSGTTNRFRWPVADVIGPAEVRAESLVALVRLDRETPGRRERVAPVVFPSLDSALQITGYRFVLRVNAPAKLRYRIYATGSAEPMVGSEHKKRSGGKPFEISWHAGESPGGEYRLLIEGYFLEDNTPVDQEISFVHSPSWPAP